MTRQPTVHTFIFTFESEERLSMERMQSFCVFTSWHKLANKALRESSWNRTLSLQGIDAWTMPNCPHREPARYTPAQAQLSTLIWNVLLDFSSVLHNALDLQAQYHHVRRSRIQKHVASAHNLYRRKATCLPSHHNHGDHSLRPLRRYNSRHILPTSHKRQENTPPAA